MIAPAKVQVKNHSSQKGFFKVKKIVFFVLIFVIIITDCFQDFIYFKSLKLLLK